MGGDEEKLNQMSDDDLSRELETLLGAGEEGVMPEPGQPPTPDMSALSEGLPEPSEAVSQEINGYKLHSVNRLKSGGRLLLKKKNVIGIDIGYHSIKVVQIDVSQNPPLLYGFAYEEIPFELRDKGKKTDEYVVGAIKKIIKSKRQKDSLCISYIAGNGVYLFSGLIDLLPPQEQTVAVKDSIADKMTFDIDESVLNFKITGESTTRAGDKLEVTGVAAKKENIKQALTWIEEAELQIIGLTTPAHSFENVFQIKPSTVPANVIIINIGARRTEINYYKDGQFVSNREISVACHDFNKAMTAKIRVDNQTIELTPAEAETLKREMGASLDPAGLKNDPVKSKMAGMARPVFEKMVTEFKRSFSFFQRMSKIDKMDKVYIVGGGANIHHLPLFLKEELEIDVELFPVKKYFRIAPGLIADHEEYYLNHLISACGLIYESKLESINLVPSATKLFSKIASYRHVWNLVVIGSFMGMLGLFVWFKTEYNSMQKYFLYSKEELQSLDVQAREIDRLYQFKEKYLAKEALVKKLIANEPNWKGVFYEISRLTPEWVYLDILEASVTGGECTVVLKGMVDTGKAKFDQIISRLLLSLNESPYFSLVELVRMEHNPKGKHQMAEFEIRAGVIF